MSSNVEMKKNTTQAILEVLAGKYFMTLTNKNKGFNAERTTATPCISCNDIKCTVGMLEIQNGDVTYTCQNGIGTISLDQVSIDFNIINELDRTTIAHNLVNKIEQYSLFEGGIVEFVKDNLYKVVKSSGGNLYIYSGTTKLWKSFSPSATGYILGKYMTQVIDHAIGSYESQITMNEEKDARMIVDNNFVEEIKKIIGKLEALKKKGYKLNIMKQVSSVLAQNVVVSSMEMPAGRPLFFPLKNGEEINLVTCEVGPRNIYNYFTYESRVTYLGENSPTPNIERFMKGVFQNQSVIDYVQELMGVCLTGETLDMYYIFCGGGRNGKSKLLELLEIILGKYCTALMKSALIGKAGTGASPELVPLIGSRLATVSETNKGEKLNESLIKRLTGGDPITVRPLYSGPITFKNVAKIIMLTNHLPDIEMDYAMKTRTIFVPFNTTFISQEDYDKLENKQGFMVKDEEFVRSLKTEHLDEVFTYFVNGYRRYNQRGRKFITPTSFKEATNDYVKEQDVIQEFIDDRCWTKDNLKCDQGHCNRCNQCVCEGKKGNPDNKCKCNPLEYKVKSMELLKAYNDWARECSTQPLNSRTIKGKFTMKGYEYKKFRTTECMGIILKTNAETYSDNIVNI